MAFSCEYWLTQCVAQLFQNPDTLYKVRRVKLIVDFVMSLSVRVVVLNPYGLGRAGGL